MDKRKLKKVLSLIFLASIVFVSYIVLKDNLVQIKTENITKHTNENKIYRKKPSNINKNGEQEKYLSHWQAVERKDSYNNELQYYCKENVTIKGDTIEIISKKENRDNKIYTSGLVESTNAYKYGYFEFNIVISEGKGIFPAIWFLPNEGSALPEIDLFEMIGNEPYAFYGVIHFTKNGVQKVDFFTHKVPIKEKYFVALEWKAESLSWYIDNQKIYTSTKGIPQKFMFITINQAIGGDWPGNPDENTIFPNKFKILSTKLEPVFKKGRD